MPKPSTVTLGIADDHPLMRNVIVYMLTSFGYEVILEAENGKILIERLNPLQLPDICLLDINMPEMDGLATTKYLKEKWPSIKILIFSLRDDKMTMERAYAAGADVYLTKMVDIAMLKRALKKLEGM